MKKRTYGRIGLFLALVCSLLVPTAARSQEKGEWPADVKKALSKAGKNRAELETALSKTPAPHRPGMLFLIVNMPDQDLQTLSANFLLENLELAYKARDQVTWGKKVPEAIFFNDVLAYANVDEARDPWRKEMYDLCMSIIKDCKTPSEAAQLLNSTVFNKLKVRYSTQRKRPHQSPKESIETGMASCTGLSILLVDACRSVAIPARVVGTPLWANKRGNHTWLEIWDGDWHFTGACEPDPKGLDRGWFVGDAAQAKKDVAEHAIYAASFQKRPLAFPLVWAPQRKDVFAENVTDRYAAKEQPNANRALVRVRVWQAGKTKRLAMPLQVVEGGKSSKVVQGESRGESADTNDMASFELTPEREYTLRVGTPTIIEKSFMTSAKELLLDIELPAAEAKKLDLSEEQRLSIGKEARTFFAASADEQSKWRFDEKTDALLATHEEALRQLAWNAYKIAPIHEKAKKDFDDNLVRFKDYVSPYKLREVGKKPVNGWPLFIAMHGGGGAPKQVNDDQWRVMQKYYSDQPSVEGYKYVALRAPNDVWNGFYDDYVPPLIINLIRQCTLFADVDPDSFYIMGYSHGGYGAFFIGPKIPDRFAAVHCSAAAPTDGTISARNLRNTRFTFMIGENDNAYGRRERCERFDKEVQKLRDENKGDYPVEMEFKKGFGHGGLPDRNKIKDMYGHLRTAAPKHLTWEPTDPHIKDFFWLSVKEPEKGQLLDVAIHDNSARITTRKVKEFALDLDCRLIEYGKPLRITIDGKTKEFTPRPSFLTLCQSIVKRGDPQLACTCTLQLEGRSE